VPLGQVDRKDDQSKADSTEGKHPVHKATTQSASTDPNQSNQPHKDPRRGHKEADTSQCNQPEESAR